MRYNFPVMLKQVIVFGLLVIAATSCVNTKKVTTFSDLGNGVYTDQVVQPAIQKNDQLSITVTSLNREATEVFNEPNQSVISSSSGTR